MSKPLHTKIKSFLRPSWLRKLIKIEMPKDSYPYYIGLQQDYSTRPPRGISQETVNPPTQSQVQ